VITQRTDTEQKEFHGGLHGCGLDILLFINNFSPFRTSQGSYRYREICVSRAFPYYHHHSQVSDAVVTTTSTPLLSVPWPAPAGPGLMGRRGSWPRDAETAAGLEPCGVTRISRRTAPVAMEPATYDAMWRVAHQCVLP
jgi:hypothetical protein